MSDKEIYAAIALELENNTPDAALWTKAFAESNGHEEATKAAYIRLRHADLKKKQREEKAESLPATTGLSLSLEPIEIAQPVDHEAVAAKEELLALRAQLKKELRNSGKFHLYQTLGLQPDASDEDIAAALNEFARQIDQGEYHAGPEFKLARDTLGDPDAREEYDYRLLESIAPEKASAAVSVRSNTAMPAPAQARYEPPPVYVDDSDSKRANLIVLALALLSAMYIGLGFTRERSVQQLEAQRIQAEQAARNAELANERQRIDNERAVVDSNERLADRIIDKASRYSEQRNSIMETEAENRRREMEYRAERERERLALEQERMEQREKMEEESAARRQKYEEERKAERERRYWACMNVELSRTYSAEASARCSSYR